MLSKINRHSCKNPIQQIPKCIPSFFTLNLIFFDQTAKNNTLTCTSIHHFQNSLLSSILGIEQKRITPQIAWSHSVSSCSLLYCYTCLHGGKIVWCKEEVKEKGMQWFFCWFKKWSVDNKEIKRLSVGYGLWMLVFFLCEKIVFCLVKIWQFWCCESGLSNLLSQAPKMW
jgi:hypothetical protein